ncbi:MAG: hypothetical protein JO205_13935 [Pseudolabrys sp.]|nr:hypothetical protein [Pseudolabrys sp.]
MSDIVLSAGARSSVLALQGISQQMSQFQLRLSTGKKVNSALDNPQSYFTSAALDQQASDLSGLLDSITNVQGAISAANNGISSIESLVTDAKTLANSALASSDPATKAAYASQYNDLVTQINNLAVDSGFNGANLLTSGSITANFNANGTSNYTVSGVDASASGLGISTVTDFSNPTEVNNALSQTGAALDSLRGMSSTFSTADTVLAVRQDFTKSMVSFLNGASSGLTASDSNADGAALLALQTRQQIAQTALTFTSNADSNVLRLFGLSRQTFG